MEMTALDAEFLADVDHFLASCDLSLCHELQIPVESATAGEAKDLPAPLSIPVVTDPCTQGTALVKPSLNRSTRHEIERAKDRQRRSVYRQRRREERQDLQRQVDELSAALDEKLRAKACNHMQVFPAWKTIASHQFEARRAAEMEQQELVAAVQSRYRLIQEFGQYMNKQFLGGKLTQDHFHDDEVNYSHKRIRLESSDAMIFESYLQELADVYAQTDEVFKDCGMELTSNDSCKPEPTWKMNRDTGYYVFTNKLALPFDFRQTSELLWKLSQILHRQDDRELYDGVGDPENCIALKFRTTSCLESGEVVSVVHRAVGHRYDEGDRLVILWRSFSEGEGLFGGMHSDETGWCVVVPSTDPTQPGTRLQICIRNFPMHFSGAEKDEATVEQFTGWLCASGSEDIAEITSSLQSMLLEEEYL